MSATRIIYTIIGLAIFLLASTTHAFALTPTPDPYYCTQDAECGCGIDRYTLQCTIKNVRELNGVCNAPDFCNGITGRCGPKCISNRCQFSCGTSITPTPTCTPIPPCALPGANPICQLDPNRNWCQPTPTPTCSIKPVCVQAPCEFPTPPGGWCGTPTPYDESPLNCRGSGGVWKDFPNACADHCGIEAMFCAQVITASCDCGVNSCWNGASCTPNRPLTAPINPRRILTNYGRTPAIIDFIRDGITNVLDILFNWTRRS